MNGAALGSRGQRRGVAWSDFLFSITAGDLLLLLNLSVSLGRTASRSGQEPFERICSSCHGLKLAPKRGRTHAGWEGTVETMRGRGASGSETDFERIVQYLTNNFGPVNSAPQSVAGDRAAAKQAPAASATARDTEWTTYGGGPGQQTLFALDQINAGNFIDSVWPGIQEPIKLWAIAGIFDSESTPLMAGGCASTQRGTRRSVVALDAQPAKSFGHSEHEGSVGRRPLVSFGRGLAY